jgi:hypothetical protein
VIKIFSRKNATVQAKQIEMIARLPEAVASPGNAPFSASVEGGHVLRVLCLK